MTYGTQRPVQARLRGQRCVRVLGCSARARLRCSGTSGSDGLPCRPAEKAGPQKRAVAGPRKAFTLENVTLETITAIPYDILKEGLKN